AHIDRDPRHDLVLDAQAELPIVVADAPTLEHVRIHARGRDRLSPIEVRPRPALEILVRVQEIALRDAVAVGIGPRAGNARHEGGTGILDGIRLSRPHPLQVLSHVHLDGGLAVAEQVVYGTAARREVTVAGDAVRAWKDVRRSKLMRLQDAVLVFRSPARG